MKRIDKCCHYGLLLLLLISGSTAPAQDSLKGDLNMTVGYVLENNQVPYVLAHVQTKVNRRFRPVTGIPIKLYLNSDSAANLVGQLLTDDQGKAASTIPGALAATWGKTDKHRFVAVFTGDEKFNPARAEATVSRAKIQIDTLPDKKIAVQIFEKKDSSWIPAKGVDVSISVKRFGANLNVNETATFSTDSTGTVTADFKRNNIPGDKNGNIIIVARVDDNDQYGSLVLEKALPWGAPFVYKDDFQKRSLYATRNKAPIWLLFMSYFMAISVWGVLLWLIRNLFRIRKLGLTAQD